MDTVKMLIDNLMDKNPLLTWTIYHERSGSVMVKLRFGDTTCSAENTDPNTNARFKRKSETQIRRDNRRAQHHNQSQNVKTRSQSKSATASAVNATETLDSSTEIFRQPEMSRSGDIVNQSSAVMDTVDYSVNRSPDMCTGLDPSASPFVTHEGSGCSSLQRTEDSMDDSFLSRLHDDESDIKFEKISPTGTIPMPNIDNHIGNDFDSDHVDECSEYDDGYTCEDKGCGYGPGGPYTGNHDNISICNLCKDVFICRECLSIGRHERHKLYIQQCIVNNVY